MKILLVLFLSMCFCSCNNFINPYFSDSNKEINEDENPVEYIKTTLSTIELPNCPENTKFDMIAINFTDGRTEDDLILGENQYCKKSSSYFRKWLWEFWMLLLNRINCQKVNESSDRTFLLDFG